MIKDINQGATKINTTATTTAMNTIKDINTNTLLDISTHKANAIQELHNILDGSLTDMVTFKNDINRNSIIHLNTASIKIEAETKETLLTYVTNHTVELQETLMDIHQRTKTDIYVDLQEEQTRLRNGLTTELEIAKNVIIKELRQSSRLDTSLDIAATIATA